MPRNAKPDVAFEGIESVVEGQSYFHRLDSEGSVTIHTICCDCSLVHVERYTPTKRGVSIRVWRDDALTEQLRKRNHISVRRNGNHS